MRKTTTTTMALVATLALIGIGSMPVQAQVTPDCDDPYTIPAVEPQQGRLLDTQESEVGMIEVDDDGTTDVRVQLESNRALLEFGVFIMDGGTCVVAADKSPPLSSCGDDEVIDTEPLAEFPPLFIDCELQPADSGQTRSYFFHVVNEGNVDLEYKAWEL